MFRGEDIKQLIPQRYPMMMVDEFEEQEEQHATTALTVRVDNIFVLPSGEFLESGLLEHIAQSCSALAGFQARQRGDTKPPVGMIVEIKNFQCNRRPLAGEKIETDISFTFSFGNMTLAHGTTRIGEENIAKVEMKIFIQ